MEQRTRLVGLATSVLVVASLGSATRATAQAFTPPKGVGSVTLAWQYVHNLGHRFSDGYYGPGGESTTTSLLLDTEYAATDRLSITFGIPYVFARYDGPEAPFSGLPNDTCFCWSSSFGDFGTSVRYRLGGDTWAVTPVLRLGQPSHAYPYRGEAVVGKQLTELQAGVFTAVRLVNHLPNATVQAGYTYSFVERPLDDIPIDRSNVFVDLGYAVNRRIYVRGGWLWQHTHGGLRMGSPTGNPFPFFGEFTSPEQFGEADRLLHVELMQFVVGASMGVGPVDVFASYSKYFWGRDAHNSRVFGLGASWYFGLPK